MANSQKYGQAYGYESISVSTAAIGPTALTVHPDRDQNPRPAFEAFCTVETNSIRYRIDGTDPTASEGHVVAAGGTFTVTGTNNVKRLKMIRVSADAVVKITYFR
jgi:hypothetical protein